ncbi:MAG: hypothetical protein U9N59_10260 [Campylobacterota bacterium]|nr:hypothetical protein [Campylobacterota bacterium]
MGKLTTIKNRIYSDYFMPSRLDEYEKIIKELCDAKYEHITFRNYKRLLDENKLNGKKYFINRHDIDTDVKTSKEYFKIEKKYNVQASYYFRQSTLDIEFMKEIEEYGSEASYHFEEIAQYCKDNHLKTKQDAIDNMDDIKLIFVDNFKKIEVKMGTKIETVCSHGDFVNRKLQIVNNEITNDATLREKLGIECETYDKDIMNSFDIYVSDRPYPLFYYPKSIFEYIGKENTICMLSHPRQWRTNFFANTFDNIKRIYEGLKW